MFKGLHRNSEHETDRIVHLSQDEDGHRQIDQNIQQESDIHHDGPMIIDIGHYDEHILDNIRHHKEHIPTIGIWAEHPQKELIETLQNIIEQEGQRGIIILWGRDKDEVVLSNFVEHIISETREEIFRIENMLDHEVYIETKIQENTISGHKYAKHHHKFHNQKPSWRKGNYQHNRRK